MSELEVAMTRHRTNLHAVAKQLGRNYGSLGRYFRGERSMPMPVLLDILDAIDEPFSNFMQEVERRMEQ